MTLVKRVVAAAALAALLYTASLQLTAVRESLKPGLCDFLGGEDASFAPGCYFSESYWEARAKFRLLARAAGAELSHREVVPGDYTMDFAVLRGSGSGVVIHSSGVHGVEGYAGSAIQCAALHERALAQQRQRSGSGGAADLDSPTIVFVHAVNPYGMAHFRRFNEHNVDLNRNAVSPEGGAWAELKARDPNVAKYEDFSEVFNPPHAPTLLDAYFWVFANAVYNVVAHGFVNLKRAIVTGQYHNPKGVYFGGHGQEPSHALLWDFLAPFADAAGPVTWIDVHTGLGPQGVDTLLVDSQDELAEALRWFPDAPAVEAPVRGLDNGGDVGAGYDLARGFVKELYETRFPAAAAARGGTPPMVLSQEFGTLQGILVARAMILENQAYQHDRTNQPFWATFTRDAFYVRSDFWRASIAARGRTVLNQAIARSSSSPPATAAAAAAAAQVTGQVGAVGKEL